MAPYESDDSTPAGEVEDVRDGRRRAARYVVPVTVVGVAAATIGLVPAFAEVGLVASKSAARRTVKEGGAYVNNVKVTSEDAVATADQLLHGRWLVLRRGKKNLAVVEVTGA